ncbi:MAG: ECF-type sigma factor [Planctomycetota bacterium]
MSRREQITRLLQGDAAPQCADELLPLVYEELRALARRRLAREQPGQTLQATVLVHEAYLRVADDRGPKWNGRGHFFGAAAQAMRRILVEQARRRQQQRRGGGLQRRELDDEDLAIDAPSADVLAVDEALQRLEGTDPRKAQIVHLRYFAGLTNQETAEVLGVSVGTIERDWRFLKAWLQTELQGDESLDRPRAPDAARPTRPGDAR